VSWPFGVLAELCRRTTVLHRGLNLLWVILNPKRVVSGLPTEACPVSAGRVEFFHKCFGNLLAPRKGLLA
jgi:hypothetical protein